MKTRRTGLFLLLLACSGLPDETAAQGPRGAMPGFVEVPEGPLEPGCTVEDFNERATNIQLKTALRYDVWGQAGTLQIPAFQIGRYEITNAQWKLYLDRNFRTEHTTTGEETLKDIARQHVKFRDEPLEHEWKPIYAFNYEVIVQALKDADAKEKDEAKRVWKAGWTEDVPMLPGQAGVETVVLPKGLKLVLYEHATPKQWYGWTKLADLQAGREYCDIRKPPEEAFVVPDGGIFTEQVKPLRDKDFARYPMRDASPVDVLRFAEWAGCHLPSEYEWERAVRADRPNTDQHPFPGKWDRQKQVDYFAWADNPLCRQGPLPVDDARVEKGDSVPYGLRHAMGNVWELTRTVYDAHPRLVPMPPPHEGGLFNYALTAKGGSWGDGWHLVQISTRTGQVGNAVLDLKYPNRADSLGFRLVRHPTPGQDLLEHSILKLAYNAGRGLWAPPYPHAYAIPRMAGADRVHIVDAKAPYLHVQDRATAIALAPLWYSGGQDPQDPGMDEKFRNDAKGDWNKGKANGRKFTILGVLRCDVPFRAGVQLAPAAAKALLQARIDYEKALKEKKKYDAKKKKGDPEFEMPPKPEEPDKYEKETIKNMDAGAGLWREAEVGPGEWLVVYWYDFIGLASKARIVEAILMVDDAKGKDIQRQRVPAGPSSLRVNAAGNAFTLEFAVDEQIDPKKPQAPPDEQSSSEWALCDVVDGWPGRRPAKASWRFKVTVPVKEGALQGW